MEKNQALDKIAKLLVLAQHPDTPEHEAKSAMNMATKLMAVHKVEMADIEGNKKPEDLLKGMYKSEVEVMYTNQDWEAILGFQVAEIFECKGILCKGGWRNREVASVVFLGSKDDLEMAIYFFEELQMLVGQEMRISYPKSYTRKRDSFALGMTSRLGMRMRDLYERVKNEVTEEYRDLMVVKTGVVQKYFKQQYPTTRQMKRKTKGNKIDSNAYLKGWDKGGVIDLTSARAKIAANG